MRHTGCRLVLALATMGAMGLAGCSSGVAPSSEASHPPVAPPTHRSTPATSPSPAAAPQGSVYGTVLDNPAMTQTADGLYLSTYPAQPGQLPQSTTLEHLATSTGQVTARHVFGPGYLSAPVTGDGALWATLANTHGEWLYRLNPATLATTGEVVLTSKPSNLYASQTANRVAYAGGGVWVAAVDEFFRVSPAGSLKLASTIPFKGADSSNVGASPDGSVLILSEAQQGVGALQRRDPASGSLLASHPMSGVVAAHVGGVTDTGVWIDEQTGMMGYVERFTAAGLTPQPATIVNGTNGIRALVADGSLWITSAVGGARLNYCADPDTGHRRAGLPLPNPSQDYLLAVGPQDFYYTVPAQNGFRLERGSVPSACRA